MIVPSLTALFSSSALQFLSYLCPFSHSMLLHQPYQFPSLKKKVIIIIIIRKKKYIDQYHLSITLNLYILEQ